MNIIKQIINKYIEKNEIIVINAYVKFNKGKIIKRNWGDELNYNMFKYINYNVKIYFQEKYLFKYNIKNYLFIGSTINYLTTIETIIWGAGVIDENLEMRAKPKKILAVRGPKTREYLLKKNIKCPDIYGDPALLLPYFYKTNIIENKRKTISIIPHYTDLKSKKLNELRKNKLINIIDVTEYKDWKDIIDKICESEIVFSSSLHGIIVAEAYCIENYWINIEDNIIGGSFKFIDFYQSIGKSISEPLGINKINSIINKSENYEKWKKGKVNLKKLIQSCPLEIEDKIKYEHPMDI